MKSIKQTQACRKCSRKNVKFERMREETKEKIRKHHLANGIGKWMLEKKTSDETKKKISSSLKGKKIAEETKNKLSFSKIGDKNPAKRLEVRIKISETLKRNPREISEDTRRKLSVKSKTSMLKRIEELGCVPRPNYNPDGCEYFDKLNIEKGWDLQHAKNGGEKRILCYYPDAYDGERNIVVEYDEPHHYDLYGNLKQKDILRMNEIINKTKCQFYRYNQKTDELRLYSPIDS